MLSSDLIGLKQVQALVWYLDQKTQTINKWTILMENDNGKCILDQRNSRSVKVQCGRMQHKNEKVGHRDQRAIYVL